MNDRRNEGKKDIKERKEDEKTDKEDDKTVKEDKKVEKTVKEHCNSLDEVFNSYEPTKKEAEKENHFDELNNASAMAKSQVIDNRNKWLSEQQRASLAKDLGI